MRFHLSLRSWVYSLFLLLLLIGLAAVVGFNRFQQMVGQEMKAEHDDEVQSQQLLLDLIDQHQELRQMIAEEALPETPMGWQRWEKALLAAADQTEAVVGAAQPVFNRAQGQQELLTVERVQIAARKYATALRQAAAQCAHPEKMVEAALVPASQRESVLLELTLPAQELRTELVSWILAKGADLGKIRENTTRHARNLSLWMVFVTVLGILVLLLFNYQIDEALILPAKQMRKLIQDVNNGDLSLRLPELKEDYLNRLAIACNCLIESLNDMSEESRRRLTQEKQLACALSEAITVPVVAFNPLGEILLANELGRELFVGGEGAKRLVLLREAVAAKQSTVLLDKQPYRLEGNGADPDATGIVGIILLRPEAVDAPLPS